MNMMDDIKGMLQRRKEIAAYLDKLLNKQAFDKKVVWDMHYIFYLRPRESV